MLSNRQRSQVRGLPTSTYDVLAEAALILVSLAVVFSFRRLFIDNSFFLPIVASTLSAHILAAAIRWVRGGLVISLLASALGLVISASLLFPPTAVAEPGRFLTRDVLRGFGTDLELAWDQFQTVVAPAEASPPFLLLVAIVMWIVAFLADWAAFRLRSPVEALIPGTAVFIFGALFAANQYRLISAIALVAAALAFVLFHRLGEASFAGAWLGTGAVQKGQAALLRSGLAIVALTLLGGAIAAQALPGYGDEPVLDLSDLDQSQDPRVVLSPLVDIRARLVNQPDVEVFTVRSPQRDYWRITSLDIFDGRIWRSRGSFENAAGPLETELPGGTSFESVTQEFNIKRLGGIWLPAAYEPAEILASPPDIGFEYEQGSGTLIVNRDLSTSDGLAYTLLSAIPSRDAAAIAAAGSSVPNDISSTYLDLPADFSDKVREEAQRITADENTPYGKALALQDYFRDPSLFTYDLDAVNGHSAQRLEDFLFEVQVGYCEQFAGSYAAMARSIGLPARVAIGFTPGEYDPTIDAFRVSGRHAHAWPEVWLDDIGWLRFEPTPGRGAPGDDVYTGQPEAQASDQLGNAPTTIAPGTPFPGDIAERGGPDQRTSTTREPQSDRANSGVIDGEATGLSPRMIALAVVILVAAAMAAIVPLGVGITRATRRRRRVAHDPRRRIGLAWSESRAAVELMGVELDEAETPSQFAGRVARSAPGAVTLVREIAEEVTVATYSDDIVDERRADRAEGVAADLAGEARQQNGRAAWWLHHMNPVAMVQGRNGLWGHLRARKRSSD